MYLIDRIQSDAAYNARAVPRSIDAGAALAQRLLLLDSGDRQRARLDQQRRRVCSDSCPSSTLCIDSIDAHTTTFTASERSCLPLAGWLAASVVRCACVVSHRLRTHNACTRIDRHSSKRKKQRSRSRSDGTRPLTKTKTQHPPTHTSNRCVGRAPPPHDPVGRRCSCCCSCFSCWPPAPFCCPQARRPRQRLRQ